MAYTFTLVSNDVDGSQRRLVYNCTLDTAYSGAVATPLSYVNAAIISPISCASIGMGIIVKRNTTAASAAANGSVFISSNTSGDNVFLTVYGRS